MECYTNGRTGEGAAPLAGKDVQAVLAHSPTEREKPMMNLEVRIREANDAKAVPLAEIPFRQDLIENVLTIIGGIGGYIGGVEIDKENLSFQFAADAERAYLEVVVE